MAKPLIIVSKKLTFYIVVILLHVVNVMPVIAQDDAQAGEEEASTETNSQNKDASAGDGNPTKKEKPLPDQSSEQRRLLQAQYPESDIVKLTGSEGDFTALWKKDQSGRALGAVLLVPSNGQTANWPNTIDVLRNELPKNGWSTLSIDIKHSARNAAADQEVHDKNLERIQAAIAFLHNQGQYNIVLAGYGLSCDLIVEYAHRTDALGMQKSVNSSQTSNLKRPVRALILISPLSSGGERLSEKIGTLPYKDMPILDIVFGSHYLDTFDSKERLQNARASQLQSYSQIKSVEPRSSARVFGSDNRLSRRVRGFLDTHAKGVEIERR